MKNNFKSTINKVTWFAVMVLALVLTACNDDPDAYKVTSGKPTIDYARIPDVLKADSFITHAFMGTTIAFVGENMTSVKQVWFNDKQAVLNTSLITSDVMIVDVPNSIPSLVTNKVYFISSDGDTIKYDFKVDVPAPLLTSMKCEYVADGDVAVINGNYFLPVEGSENAEVIFTPNIKGTVVSTSLKQIQVIVPAGATAGPVSVKSRYGVTRSTAFYFRDNRGIILDWDNTNASGGWRAGVLASTNPTGVSGNYVRFSGKLDDSKSAGSTWNEDGFSFDLWGTANGRPEGDLFNIDPAKAVLKFEINVDKAWSSCALQMIFTPWSTTNTNSYIGDATVPRGIWNPWAASGSYKTDGWITVSFPLTSFKYAPNGEALSKTPFDSKGNYGGLTFFVWNGGVVGTECNPDICIDNIRVVPAE